MSVYDLGDPVILSLDVDVDGTPTTPTTISLVVTAPAGSAVGGIYTPTATATGRYEHTLLPDVDGDYTYRWLTTGVGAGAEVGGFTVGTQVVSLSEVRAWLGPNADDRHDDELRRLIAVTTTHFKRWGVHVGTATHRLTSSGGTMILPSMYPATVTVTDDYSGVQTGWTVSDAGLLHGLGNGVYNVTVRAGVHEDVRMAALFTVQHNWETQRGAAPTAYAGGTDETFTGGRGFFLPARAKELLEPHIGVRGVA